MKKVLFIFVSCFIGVVLSKLKLPKITKYDLKNLQGPPEEFKEHLLPKPAEYIYETSDSSIKHLNMNKNKNFLNGYEWKGDITCDSETWFTVRKIFFFL